MRTFVIRTQSLLQLQTLRSGESERAEPCRSPIDDEVVGVQSKQLLAERHAFEEEILAGANDTENPADQVPK